jgi:adenylate cyclase
MMSNGVSVEEEWRKMLQEGISPSDKRRQGLYARLPANPRCRMCKVPFEGFGGQIMRLFGKHPSNFNPHLCNECESFARTHIGGAEIRLSMLFADIRGSTSLAEHLPPAKFRALIDRFYAVATDVLARSEALIDKLAGDQVSGYFIPGFVGPEYPRVAVQAAQELLRATGYSAPGGAWIPVGIGVHTGNAFVGSVGSQNGVVDVTALGDAVNIAARLASNAGAGEILISYETYSEAGLDLGILKQKQLELKGRTQPVSVYVFEA